MKDKRITFAKALRVPSPEDVRRITEHFQAQKDLFTQCPKCGERLVGTYEQLMAHQCLDDLIYGTRS